MRKESRNEYRSGGGPGGVIRVISYDRVQEQLKLSEEQRLQIAEIVQEVGQMEAHLFAPLPPTSTTDGNEWSEKRRQREESTRQAVASAGDEILLAMTPAQQTRLKEICLQAQGLEALFKPEVIRALDLTATQQVKLAGMRQEAERQAARIRFPEIKGNARPPFASDPASAEQRVRGLERDTERRMISSVLTPVQQAKLQQMRGREFTGLARLRSPYVGTAVEAGGTSKSSQ